MIGTKQIILETGKEVEVLSSKETKYGTIYYCDDNEWYTEDEFDIKYTLTPEALMYLALQEAKVEIPFNFETYHTIVDSFMEQMEKSGYIMKE